MATIFAPMLAKAYGWHAVIGLLMIPVALTLVVFTAARQRPARRAGASRQAGRLRRASWQPDAWWFCLLYFVTFGGFVGLS